MDESVLRAMQRWPDVPAVYGWLALDRRGRWRMEGTPVRNRTTIEFINRNYARDARGRWYFQNGPQRAFVDLDYTPWVFVLDGAGRLRTHAGAEVRRLEGVWVDDRGHLLLASEQGVGIVSDRDLDPILERFRGADREALSLSRLERSLERLRRGERASLCFLWKDEALAAEPIAYQEVPGRFGFVPRPREPASADDERRLERMEDGA